MSTRKRHQQQYYVLWLETEINLDNEELKKNLSNTYNNFQIYDEPNTCVNFISNLPTDDSHVFLILVGIRCEYVAEMVINLSQIANIYLYDPKTKESLTSGNKCIRSSTNNSKNLFYTIVRGIELREGIPPAPTVFTFNSTPTERSLRDLDSDHQSATFVWFQLLVDVVRQLPHTDAGKEEMITFLHEYFNGFPVEQKQLNQFIKGYDSNEAIKWYTKAGFLFRVLNRALRTQNIDNIFKLRYFLQDL